MLEEGRFGIVVRSDVDYENIIIELRYNRNPVAVLNCEKGLLCPDIDFYGFESRNPILNFKYFEFIFFLNETLKLFYEINNLTDPNICFREAAITSDDNVQTKYTHHVEENNSQSNSLDINFSNATIHKEFHSIIKTNPTCEYKNIELKYGFVHFATLCYDKNLSKTEILIFAYPLKDPVWVFDCLEFIDWLKQSFLELRISNLPLESYNQDDLEYVANALLLELKKILPKQDKDALVSLFKKKEWDSALEFICALLLKRRIPINYKIYNLINGIGQVIHMDESKWIYLEELIKV